MTQDHKVRGYRQLIIDYVADRKEGEAAHIYAGSPLTRAQYLDAVYQGRKLRDYGTTLPAPVERDTTAILQDDEETNQDQ